MYKYLKVSLMIAVTVLALQFVNFTSTDAQAGNEEFHLKILEALKRMNVRLVRIEASKLRSLKAVQESLLNQIMALRTSLEQIQATGEMSKTEMLASVEGVKTKILDVESHMKNEVMQAFDGQNREDKSYRAQSQALFSQLKDSLATDMGSFSKANQQQSESFSEANNKQLQQIVSVLEEQNKKLLLTQALFKTDLIPALNTQSEETRQALLTDLSQSRAFFVNTFAIIKTDLIPALKNENEKMRQIIVAEIAKQTRQGG